jgi:hypothetical protein
MNAKYLLPLIIILFCNVGCSCKHKALQDIGTKIIEDIATSKIKKPQWLSEAKKIKTHCGTLYYTTDTKLYGKFDKGLWTGEVIGKAFLQCNKIKGSEFSYSCYYFQNAKVLLLPKKHLKIKSGKVEFGVVELTNR